MPHPNDAFWQELQTIRRALNGVAAQARMAQEASQAVKREHAVTMGALVNLGNLIEALKVSRTGSNEDPGIVRIEDIPGTRIPYDAILSVPIDANSVEMRQDTFSVSQFGPFVVVKRSIIFLSQFQAQREDPETGDVATFLGRSNGRFRPAHSANDFLDALLPADVTRVVAAPGTGAPSYASPSSHSPYRTMEFDGRIELRNQGSQMPRSNVSVPTAFYTTGINAPWELGALDYYGRSEVIEIDVKPQHVNNPDAGNIQALVAGSPFPFLDAQYDHHEGINDEFDAAVGVDDPDPVTRLPAGELFVILHGYRILQPPTAVTELRRA